MKEKNEEKASSKQNAPGMKGTEELTEYLHINSSCLKLISISVLLVLAALAAWGIIGRLPLNRTETGVVVSKSDIKRAIMHETPAEGDEDKMLILCFINTADISTEKLERVRDQVAIEMPDGTGFTGEIQMKLNYPVEKKYAGTVLNVEEWVMDKLMDDGYGYMLIISPDKDISAYIYTFPRLTIRMDEVAPIYYLLHR